MSRRKVSRSVKPNGRIFTNRHGARSSISVERNVIRITQKLPARSDVESVLLIDDDTELCQILQGYLARYDFRVATENNGESGLQRALSGDFAIVLLDVMLPGLDGFEVLRRIRASSQISVLLLTARGEDIDRIVGLEIGADDYLPKPFNPRELLARIRAILRRSQNSQSESNVVKRIAVADLYLDTGARRAACKNSDLDLTSVEFDLLRALMEAPGRILTREYLCELVLDRSFSPFDRSLDTHVCHLRRKLDETAGAGDRIKTIRSVGYQLAVSTSASTGALSHAATVPSATGAKEMAPDS
jgi:DNA-binding response OmpR family regulator